MTRLFLALVLTALVGASNASIGRSSPPLNVLFLGDQGPHQPALRFRQLAPVLQRRGIELTYTEDLQLLSVDSLREVDALVVYANIDTLGDGQAQALLDYVAAGGGFVPLHSASYCFRNQPDLVALIGAQFHSHGAGSFRTQLAAIDHPVLYGFGGFESWDETYVHHLHNEAERVVLEYRVDGERREPWTWVRSHGRGRVFYTAWGHDERTWSHSGFHNLVERGIRFAAGGDPRQAGPYLLERAFEIPELVLPPADGPPLSYIEVGREIPNYIPSTRWGEQGEPLSRMQEPLPPEQAIQRIAVPEGFRVELFASEPDLGGKPICMAWDERGRLWVAETLDYPNQLQPPGQGRDRIRICEDTTGDGRADRFTVFAEGLSIPTGIAFYRGGVIVQNGTETIYLKDTTGDGLADERQTLITGWAMNDTHGGVSNFQYGLDNWIWAMQGYNDSRPVALGQPQQPFRMGFFRLLPDGSQVEFIRSTNNNTWGLGISEEGLIFGSTANGNPSVFMPIANRYYERVRGWTPSLTLSSIADSNRFLPITDRVRQVDHFGGYTAAAGHALYTARQYPEQYWNRTAFVTEPTGHLVATFVLQPQGSGFRSTNPFNLFASDDEWSAPIMAEVGPDGQVWVIDWYNYIVQHNPTPQGFETGRGNAYETRLRDKRHGRIYRVIYDAAPAVPPVDLSQASPQGLVAALSHPVMLVRKHAQRLLVERGEADVADGLIALIDDRSYDSIGLNVGAIHALWTLHGLGLLDGDHGPSIAAVYRGLTHPSPGVRRNAALVLPPTTEACTALLAAALQRDVDPHVRLAALLAMADAPPTVGVQRAVVDLLTDETISPDRWLVDAATSAASQDAWGFLQAATGQSGQSDPLGQVARVVAGHWVRGDDRIELGALFQALQTAPPSLIQAIFEGLASGGRGDRSPPLTDEVEQLWEQLAHRAGPAVQPVIVQLATAWGSQRLADFSRQLAKRLMGEAADESLDDQRRLNAARQAVEFQVEQQQVVEQLLSAVGPRMSPELASGFIAALQASRLPSLGTQLIQRMAELPPAAQRQSISLLLSRAELTTELLAAIEAGSMALSDLAVDQRQALAAHPDRAVRVRARRVLEQSGSLPSPDRQQVLEQWAHVADARGDSARGQRVYMQHCAKCHQHRGQGTAIGPDLTGMSVHPKPELLVHILDPSRSVENNFRAYSLLTVDGQVLTGMLAAESRTAIELFDTEGKKQVVLREEVEQLTASPKSIMPEGFEKAMQPQEMTDLLEFLADRGKYVPLDLSKVASVATDRGMFIQPDGPERMLFEDWSAKTFQDVPFYLVAPRDGRVLNALQLYGPGGPMSRQMPRQASLVCAGAVKAIHLLGGVAGWGYPLGQRGDVSLIVRLRYADGEVEEHPLLNGVHIADYIRRVDVPESQFAFDLGGKQLRYLSLRPRRTDPLSNIEFIKGPDATSPVVMAVTIEPLD